MSTAREDALVLVGQALGMQLDPDEMIKRARIFEAYLAEEPADSMEDRFLRDIHSRGVVIVVDAPTNPSGPTPESRGIRLQLAPNAIVIDP